MGNTRKHSNKRMNEGGGSEERKERRKMSKQNERNKESSNERTPDDRTTKSSTAHSVSSSKTIGKEQVKPNEMIFETTGTIKRVPEFVSSNKESESVSQATSPITTDVDGDWARREKDSQPDKQNIIALGPFVRENLWPHCKFITGEEQLGWDPNEHSMCQFVLNGMNVREENKIIMWQKCQKEVHCTISRKRNEVTGKVKSKYFRETIMRESSVIDGDSVSSYCFVPNCRLPHLV